METPDDMTLALQARVEAARAEHDDLTERERVCRVNKYITSADVLAEKRDRAFDELCKAKAALADHLKTRSEK